MCSTCGCGESKAILLEGNQHQLSSVTEVKPRILRLEADLLAKNDAIADKNRDWLAQRNIRTLNLISSPGSGKTTLLTETLKALEDKHCAVIEGDQQTSNDAAKIRATGTQAVQINTGKGCHLDAEMVARAIDHLDLQQHSLLFIENVGNLICPASFDLGELHKVVIISVTEGDDKPLKYPDVIAKSTLMIINKIDLLPYVQFDPDLCITNARRINPEIQSLLLSSTTGEGLPLWLRWVGEH
ncbi:hydrogenase nickel incorporation protein HypB [Vibrio hangzhouensis]|uniref:hydrogenase nickel incorporation protein HypB n=1 Tax=Vibrio hangzhouensis TaxID=462991 RepID=UPI001C959024|nr:hydrogenase nickel incorporation protein HypB [Vibrio hangzhouensis]MBY6196421.1 hydrogenase nickel incorporation protein HypB [Vibrio hangzhouensis]